MQIQANQQLLSHLPLIGGYLEGAPPAPFFVIKAPDVRFPHRLRGGSRGCSAAVPGATLPDFNCRIALIRLETHRADDVNDLAYFSLKWSALVSVTGLSRG
jgi:hypothetical protein